MRLLLDLHRSGQVPQPLAVTLDERLTVAELAAAIHEATAPAVAAGPTAQALTIGVHGPGGVASLPPAAAAALAGLRSGMTVSLLKASAAAEGSQRTAPTVVLRVVDGPGPAREYHLPAGPTVLGRDFDCAVRLEDPTISKRHARIEAGETLEIVDLNSANGVLIDGVLEPRSMLKVGNIFTLGDTSLQVVLFEPTERGRTSPVVPIIRSPRVELVFPSEEFPAPEPPQPVKPQRMPWIGLVTPLIFGAVLYFVTRNPASMVFVGLSPIMMLGSFLESRMSAKREFRHAVAEFEASVASFRAAMAERAEHERAVRLREHPGALDAVSAIDAGSPLIWSRRQDRPGFLELRLARGRQRSRSKVTVPSANRTTAELWRATTALAEEFRWIDGVPITADLKTCGAIGVAGLLEVRQGAARGLLLQAMALHSPSDLVLAAMAPPQHGPDWDWLAWMPHVASAANVLSCEPLAATAGAISTLATSLEGLIESRIAARQSTTDPAPLPAVLVLIDAEVPVERARLVELSERGAPVAVHAIWLAGQTAALPAICRSFINVAGATVASTGDVLLGEEVAPAVAEPLTLPEASRLARTMAPWTDAGVLGGTDAVLPAAVSFLDLAGDELVTGEGVRDRWQATSSAMSSGKRRPATLRAPIGLNASGAYTLDLRAQGPHALVGGTTGAGKSELLQTWILGLATMQGPDRVNFLLVDYKGGSAFAECVSLPHTVGLVTDLTPHLVARALTSLHAELRYREKVLHRAKAKDLQDLERKNPAASMPSLVIVVDEFAALASEVPEFVDGMVNIAQRGRSLGLHLILATQRPAGVIKDNLRANTNLRVALRLADADDSNDVIGTDLASTFPQDIPGRAAARMGPGRLVPFQTAYVGGWTRRDERPKTTVEEFRFGARLALTDQTEDDAGEPNDLGPTDIQRVVAATREAADSMALAKPRRPWLPELAATYRLLDLPRRRTDAELVIAARDEPEEQLQTTAAFYPDTDGNMAVFGTGGSGKSAVLRTVAAAAGLTVRGGVCHVYALDFGARGLTMLESLPHVGAVIPGEDHERIARLLRLLRGTIDERARRYAKANAGTITEYRAITGQQAEPRIILLLDGIAAFRQAYEVGPQSKWFDMLQSIAADGRPVGVHLVVSADRPGSIPTALASVIQRRLVLRLASDTDYAMLGVPADGFGAQTPPGRGFLDGYEVQVAVLGGDPNVAEQARRTQELAEVLLRGGVTAAAAIESMPERVALTSLPAAADGLPALGIADESLGPIGFPQSGTLLVSGPPASGRTTAVATMVASVRRAHPERPTILLAGKRSALLSVGGWSQIAQGESEVGDCAAALAAALQDEHHKPCLVVLESASDFSSSGAETQLQDLVKACRDYGHLLIAEAEISAVGGSWGLLAALKAGRQGLLLQPDQLDGDSVLRTPFPRVSRAEFPPGRGFLVFGGKASRVQVAIPE